MSVRTRWLALPITLVAVLALGMPPSSADHATRDDVVNLRPVADIENSDPFPINSDMAFWGDLAYQGNFEGFQIHDISNPEAPFNLVDLENCAGGQGDVFVWDDLLVYARNSPAGAGVTCDGIPTPVGFEGIHLWDVSDPLNPFLVHSVDISASSELPGEVTVAGGAGAGTYGANKASWGAVLESTTVTGTLEVVNDGVEGDPDGTLSDGCEEYDLANEEPPGNQITIAVVDRGFCGFAVKAFFAEDAGAEGIIVVNNVAGTPGTMGGSGTEEMPVDDILGVHVSDVDGADIKTSDGEEATIEWTGELSGCGSHTLTGVPDPANNRVLVYVGGSSGSCPGMDLVDIPLDDWTMAEWYDLAVANRSCHDITVYLIHKNRAVCSGSWAGEHGYTYFSMDAADGGSLEQPVILYEQNIPSTATIGHTSGFSWDGRYLYWSHEPGGGTAAQCEITDPIENRQMWLIRAETGNELSRWTIPSQSAQENCASVHIMQSIPTTNGNDVLTTGTYQAGTYILDVTNPTHPIAIGWSDPPPRVPTTLLAGAWATYWYNGYLYESDILYGLHVHESTSPQAQTPVELPFVNPQTMMGFDETDPPVQATCRGQAATHVGTPGADTITGTPGDDVIVGLGGNDVIRGKGGDDLICAGPGRDRVSGGAGNDRIFGQGGNDILRGGAGNDLLHGGGGRDICRGGPGTDRGVSCEVRRGIP